MGKCDFLRGFEVEVMGVNMGCGVRLEVIFDGVLGKDGGRGMCERERECAIGELVVE